MKTLIRVINLLLLLLVIPIFIWAQTARQIQVVDQNGRPIEGATIRIKGSDQITKSNKNGVFTFILKKGDVLIGTSIGFKTKEILYDESTGFKIALEESLTSLDDIVVVGYGSKTKKELTGSVTSVKMEEITETQAAESFESMLQGRVAGVNIQLSSGEPGATPNVIIRGLAAVSRDDGSTILEPLYVVDGVPIISTTGKEFAVTSTNVLADLNPSDIEEIVVLKDAYAAAIYGSRAANGVILITTKKGKRGKPQINLNSRTGINIIPQLQDVAGGMKEREQVKKLYELYAPYGVFMPSMYTDVTNPFFNNSSDWQGYLYNTSVTQDYNASIRGAGDFGQYSISLGFMDNNGILLNTGFNRYSNLSNTTFNALNNKLVVNNTLALSRTIQLRRSSPFGESSSNSNALNTQYSSLLPLPDDAKVQGADVYGIGKSSNVNDRIRFSSDASLQILKDLSYKMSLSLEMTRAMNDSFNQSRRTLWGSNSSSVGDSRNLLFQNTLNYTPKFADHSLSILIGQSAEKMQSKISTVNSVASAPLLTPNVLWPKDNNIGSSNYGANTLLSYFSRIDYAFQQKYLLGASIRTDGSSKFGIQNRWGLFPSISGGWNFNKEEIFKDWTWLSNGKIRGSFGLSGTTWDENYLALGLMDGGSLDQYNSLLEITYGGIGGFTPTWYNGFKNENLTWVKSQMGNIGLDLSLFDNKIEIIVDAYEKLTKGLLLTTSLPTTSGYNEVYRNAADVLNRGIEFTLNSNLSSSKEFNWNMGLNFAYNKNRVVALPNGNADIVKISTSGQDFGSIIRSGAPLNGFFFYESQGIYQTENDIPIDPKTGRPLIGLQKKKLSVGDRNFKDQNNDFIIDVNDRVYAGDPNPKWTGGWTNDFFYKGFGLNIVSTFVIGREIVNTTLLNRLRLGKNFAGASSLPNFDNYSIWEKSGDLAKYPSLNPWSDVSQIVNYDSEYIEDGSYFKIKSATLSYQLPSKILSRIPFDRIRFYCTMDNVVTFQNYKGPDAELVSLDGFDNSGGYPMRRMVMFGLSLGL